MNAPDPSYMPETDGVLPANYSNDDLLFRARALNKVVFQNAVWFKQDPNAPLIVWNNRLAEHQKGPQLLDAVLPGLMADYQNMGLQVAIVADGEYAPKLAHTIAQVDKARFGGRVVLMPFSESLERMGYGGADALLNCSLYAPCEMVKLKGPKYGVIPIVRGTGGLLDTVFPFKEESGNGIVFTHYDANGLRWGINEFLKMYNGNRTEYEQRVRAVNSFADKNFTVERMASDYIKMYERILDKPLTRSL